MKYCYFIWPVLLSCFCIIGCTEESTSAVRYVISHQAKDSIPKLKITMEFKRDTSGVTRLTYENEAWGEKNLMNCLSGLSSNDKADSIVINRDSSWIEVHHSNMKEKAVFQYELHQDIEETGNRGGSYRPIIKEEYFHVFAHNMFMVPEHLAKDGGDLLDVELDWIDTSQTYVTHNSFGSGMRVQELENITLEDFQTAIFVGGDFRIYHKRIDKNDIYLASRGEWLPFKDSTVVDILVKTIKAQRDFWADHSQKYFTVTMRPIKQERGSSFQGTGLTNSFATSISNNEYTDTEQLVYLFNHELQHNWIGQNIENDNEEEQYWFSEGFTEYYTFKNIAKHQINDLTGKYFVEKINETIRNLGSSPVREAPNSEINYDNYWSNRDYGKLPYYRGALFAFYLDYQIMAKSESQKSLDDLMRQFHRSASENGQKIDHEYFVASARPYLGENFSKDFKTYIEMGTLLPLASIFEALDLEFEPTSKVFDLGFQLASNQTDIIEVDDTSAAYMAGLRKGDMLLSRSIYFGNIEQAVELTVKRGSEEQPISYLPVKIANIPQLKNNSHNLKVLGY